MAGKSQIRGTQIKDDTLTGADVNEDTLIMKYFTTHKYTLTSSSDAQFVRFNAAGSNGSGQVNNRFVVPAGGKLSYVAFRSDATPGNTEIAICKISDGTADFGSGSPSADVIQNVNTANTVVLFDFSSANGASFNAGQVVGIRVNPTNNHGNVDLTCVWEFDWSS